jgi:rhodanese-related sulfurtransferase
MLTNQGIVMKELSRTRRLTISILIFVFIIIVGFITFKPARYEYKLSIHEIQEYLQSEEYYITPTQLSDQLSNEGSPIILVDVRSPYDFEMGHLKNAINIPVSEILSKENVSFFEEAKNQTAKVVIYGSNQLQANGPWMFLKQIGYPNMKVLLGGYDYFIDLQKNKIESSETSMFTMEDPDIDYAKFMEERSSGSIEYKQTEKQPTNIIPMKRKKKSVTVGGC